MNTTNPDMTLAEAATRTGLSESTIGTNPDFLTRIRTRHKTMASIKDESETDPSKRRAAMLADLTQQTEFLEIHIDLAKKEFAIPTDESGIFAEISLEQVAEKNNIFDADELAADPELANLLIAGMRAEAEISRLEGISEAAREGLQTSNVIRELTFQALASYDIQARAAAAMGELSSPPAQGN